MAAPWPLGFCVSRALIGILLTPFAWDCPQRFQLLALGKEMWQLQESIRELALKIERPKVATAMEKREARRQ